MSSIAGIYDRDAGERGGDHGSALFGMPHGADIRIAGDDADGIRHAFAFGGGRGGCVGKAQNASSQVQHRSFKAQPCSGAGLIKTGCQFFAGTGVGVFGHVGFDIAGQIKKLLQLFDCKVERVHQVSHIWVSPFLYKRMLAAGSFSHVLRCECAGRA